MISCLVEVTCGSESLQWGRGSISSSVVFEELGFQAANLARMLLTSQMCTSSSLPEIDLREVSAI